MTRPRDLAQLRQLVPAFFGRFFENELTAGFDDLKTAFFALLAVLAAPGFILPLFLAGASAPVPDASGFGTDPAGWGWSMIARYQGPEVLRAISRADKTFYLGFAMIASGILSVITWNTLLTDKRDRLVLGALPVRPITLVAGKLIALSAYVALVALAMHALASVAFGFALAANTSFGFALRGIAAHFLASSAASIFVMMAIVAVQGLTLALLGPRGFGRVSPLLQLAMVAAIVSGVIALPAISGSVVSALQDRVSPERLWILSTPPVWFLGLYERVLGTDDGVLLDLASTAMSATVLVVMTALVSFGFAHRRLHDVAVDTPSRRAGRSVSAVLIAFVSSAISRDPQIRAVARFFLTTVIRNHRQRLVLASAMGAASVWGLPAWISLVDPPATPQLALLSWALTAQLFLLVGLRVAAWLPIDLKAGWAFELSSLSWRTTRAAMERVMFVVAVLPAMVLFGTAYWWLWGAVAGLLHVLFTLSIGVLLIELLLWRIEAVPCTRPWRPEALWLRNAWPIYLAVVLMLTPGVAGVELLLLTQPIACVCFAAYVLVLARQMRVAAVSRQALTSTEPVEVISSALRAAQLSDERAPSAERDRSSSGTIVPEPFLSQRSRRSSVTGIEWRGAMARLGPGHLIRDVRLALRRLIAAPIFTAFSVVTLGCGVGITTAVYSIVYAALWAPPPVHEVDRIADVSARDGRSTMAFSWPDFADFRERQTAFTDFAAATHFQSPLVGGSVSEVVNGEAVNGLYFHTFGIRPVLGRTIQPSDDAIGAPPVAVLSHDVWRLRFGGAPNVIGTVVKIDGRMHDVIGVAPKGFRGWDFSNLGHVPAVWVPIATAPAEVQSRLRNSDRGSHWLVVKGRLAPERTLEQASAELMTIGRALEAEFPTRGAEPGSGRSPYGRRWSAGAIQTRDSARLGLIGRMFVGAVALVLLIGCTNLANLGLARGSSREHEMAVRRALGAARIDLIREQLVESTLVAAASGLVAALIIRATTTSFIVEVPAGPGRFVLLEPHMNMAVLIFAASAGLCALVTFGIWPALQLTQPPAREGLSTDGGTTPPHWHVHRRLITWQVAASVTLFLVAAACINVIVVNALHDTGVDVDRLAIVGVDFDTNRYDAVRTRSMIEVVVSSAARHPDISAVAVSANLPFGVGMPGAWSAAPADASINAAEPVQFVSATPDIFRTLGVRLVHGRGFGSQDTLDAPRVAVINLSYALRTWGTGHVVGREMLLSPSAARPGARMPVERVTVVGVAADTDVGRTGTRDNGLVYVPLDQHPPRVILFTARSERDPRAALVALRAALRQVDPDLVVDRAATGTLFLAGHFVVLGFVAALVSTLGTLALLLAMSGLFGVVSHVVSRRTRELGVRIALGAERSRIMRLVFVDGLRPVIDGLAAGLFAGAVCRALIAATMSASVAAIDPIAFVMVPVLFVLTALGACYWPARRASRIDPNVALRQS